MARVNVYLPDDLAERARAAGVNVSATSQNAIRAVLAGMDTNAWLDRIERQPPTSVSHERVLSALEEARDDFGA